jgi:large subunit ribosomal protein L16
MGKLWIKLFTNIPITKKALASRMGKGKGNISHWVSIVKKGQVLFEISGISKNKAFFVLKKSKTKLPIKTKIAEIIY